MLWKTWLLVGSVLALLVASRVYVVLHRDIPVEIEQPEVVRWLDEAGRYANVLTWVSYQLGVEHATWPVKAVVNFGAKVLFSGFNNNICNITVRYTTVDKVPVTIFLPDDMSSVGRLPTMVYFHGGGWTWFSVDVYAGFIAQLSKLAKIQIVAVEYRKAPQHPFPAAFEDGLTVTLGLIKRADDFRIMAGKLMVGGDGAGANIAAAVAQTTPSKIFMQLLINPALQILDFETPSYQDNIDVLPGLSSANRNIYHWLSYAAISKDYLQFAVQNRHISLSARDTIFSSYVNSKRYLPPYLEVTKRQTKHLKGCMNFIVSSAFEKIVTQPKFAPLMTVNVTGLPNLYMMTSQYDVYRDEGIMYANRLFEADVKVKLEHYRDSFHGFTMFSGYGPIKFEVGKKAMTAFADFLQAMLKEDQDAPRTKSKSRQSVKI